MQCDGAQRGMDRGIIPEGFPCACEVLRCVPRGHLPLLLTTDSGNRCFGATNPGWTNGQ